LELGAGFSTQHSAAIKQSGWPWRGQQEPACTSTIPVNGEFDVEHIAVSPHTSRRNVECAYPLPFPDPAAVKTVAAKRGSKPAGKMGAALAPIQARSAKRHGTGPAPTSWGEINTERCEAAHALLRDEPCIVIDLDPTLPPHSVGQTHPEPPGDMIVARAGKTKAFVTRPRSHVRRHRACRDQHHTLNHACDMSCRQPVIAMPTLPFDLQEPCRNQLRQVPTGRLRGDTGDTSELGCGQGSTVHQGLQHASAGRFADEGRNVSDRCCGHHADVLKLRILVHNMPTQ
jgi:hypothetical protein